MVLVLSQLVMDLEMSLKRNLLLPTIKARTLVKLFVLMSRVEMHSRLEKRIRAREQKEILL